LRKEVARGGKRKDIPESDDEEEIKKVSYNYCFSLQLIRMR